MGVPLFLQANLIMYQRILAQDLGLFGAFSAGIHGGWIKGAAQWHISSCCPLTFP
jgi:hypothetical protein